MNTYSGTLLEGELLPGAFGFQDGATGLLLGFRFVVTGGTMQAVYGGPSGEVGVLATVEGAGVTGAFTSDFAAICLGGCRQTDGVFRTDWRFCLDR